MENGKFHPHTEYKKGTRKSRDQKDRTKGVRLARNETFDSRYPTPRIGKDIPDSTRNDPKYIGRARERIEHLGDRETAKRVLLEEGYEHRVIKRALDLQYGKERKARVDEGWQGRALSIPQLKKMLDAQYPESSTNAEDAIKQYYIGSATHQHARTTHPDYKNYCHHCGLNLGVN